jgi:uncharacterized protein (DUF305 family)
VKTKLAICILAVITVFSACGSSDSTSEASFNAADVMFAQMMIPHHEQAIEMSDIALDPTVTASPAVIELANEIKSAQDPEISLMKSFLAEWNEPLTPDDGMDHGSMMDGMLTPQQLNELASLTGSAFDAKWATAMIAHHEGAVSMANDVIADGTHSETTKLAEVIITTQQAEIEELEAIAGS